MHLDYNDLDALRKYEVSVPYIDIVQVNPSGLINIQIKRPIPGLDEEGHYNLEEKDLRIWTKKTGKIKKELGCQCDPEFMPVIKRGSLLEIVKTNEIIRVLERERTSHLARIA